MDDTELTKKAIAELLKDMNDSKERDSLPTERKKNPLGKPNKRFLGRTINSVMKHNERQSDNNHRRCQHKLKELDAKQRKREYKQMYRPCRTDAERGSESESSHEVISSASESKDHKERSRKNIKKNKRKSKKKKQKSSSSSSTSSSSDETESDSSILPTTTRKHKKHKKSRTKTYLSNEEKEREIYADVTNDHSFSYYVDPHVAYAAMAYGHMNRLLQQQMVQEQQTIKDELDENVEIPSDLSLSYQSESSLNISLNSSSAEEDENGILTFKLISSDEEKTSDLQRVNTKRKEFEDNIVMVIDSDDNDKSSIKSYISLESKTSETANSKTNEILLLSSSSTESGDLELIETISETKQESSLLELVENNENKTDEADQVTENFSKIDEVITADENIVAIGSQLLEKEETGKDLVVNEEQNTAEVITADENIAANGSQLLEKEETSKDLVVNTAEAVATISENEIPTIEENTKVFENSLNINKDNDEEIYDDNSALTTNKIKTPQTSSETTMIDLTED